ncbi:hypothetical protein D3C74_303320 [compost metagenome]
MGFLSEQPELHLWDWVMRSIIAYLFLIFAAKWMGQRSISQLRFIDFITAMLLGNILAGPLSNKTSSMLGSMICTVIVVLLYIANSLTMLKWRLWDKFLEPDPLILIKDGTIIMNNVRKARITVEYLLSALRLLQMEDISKIALALWEPGGNISAFLHPNNEKVTREDLGIAGAAFEYSPLVIKQGVVKKEVLHKFGYDENWLEDQISRQYNMRADQVYLATLSETGNIKLLNFK